MDGNIDLKALVEEVEMEVALEELEGRTLRYLAQLENDGTHRQQLAATA